MCRPSVPPKRKIVPKDVKKAIQQATNVCYNSEDTPACQAMWDTVGELARQMEREILQKNLDEMCLEDPISCREYD